MTKFNTRVELLRSEPSDYTRLHEQLIKKGFSQIERPDATIPDNLAPTDYDFQGAYSRSDVLELAATAAASIKPHFHVRVENDSGLTFLLQSPDRQ